MKGSAAQESSERAENVAQQLHAGSFVNSAQMVVAQAALKAIGSFASLMSFRVQPASLGAKTAPPLLYVAKRWCTCGLVVRGSKN